MPHSCLRYLISCEISCLMPAKTMERCQPVSNIQMSNVEVEFLIQNVTLKIHVWNSNGGTGKSGRRVSIHFLSRLVNVDSVDHLLSSKIPECSCRGDSLDWGYNVFAVNLYRNNEQCDTCPMEPFSICRAICEMLIKTKV